MGIRVFGGSGLGDDGFSGVVVAAFVVGFWVGEWRLTG